MDQPLLCPSVSLLEIYIVDKILLLSSQSEIFLPINLSREFKALEHREFREFSHIYAMLLRKLKNSAGL